MNSPVLFLLFLLLLLGNVVAYEEQLHATIRNSQDSDEDANASKTIDDLFKSYDKRLRPNFRGDPVTVGVTMFINSISSVSEINMDFTVDFHLRQSWKDPRLVKDESEDDELILGGEILDKIWRPDTFFVNAKSATMHATTTKNAFVRIKNDGFVTQSLRLTVTPLCTMDLRLFPMDTQICSLEIESYAYPMEHVMYFWMEGPNKSVAFHEDLHVLRFQLKEFSISEMFYSAPTGNHSRLVFHLKLVRFMGHYIIHIYVPSSLLVVLSWLSFWLERNCATVRAALSVTTILTLTAFASNANNALPKLDYLKSMDIYLAMCFIMVLAVLVEFAMVNLIGNKPWTPINHSEVLSQLNTVEGKRLANSGGLKAVKKIDLSGLKVPSSGSKSIAGQNLPIVSLTEPVWKSFEQTSKDTAECRKSIWSAPLQGTTSIIPKSTAFIPHQTSLTCSRVVPSLIEKPTTSTFSSDHLSLNEFILSSSDHLKNDKDFPLLRLKIGGGNEIFHKKSRFDLKNYLVSGLKRHDHRNENISMANPNVEIAKSIDNYSKILFPSLFLIFHSLYWITYVTLSSSESSVRLLSH